MGDRGVSGSGGSEPAREQTGPSGRWEVAGQKQRQHWWRSGGALGLLALLALGLARPARTAPAVSEAWVARYNGSESSYDEATKVVVDGAGNVYVTGSSIGSATSSDYATVKYDASGNQLWVARYNGPGNDNATALAVDGGGNVYVTGYSYGDGTNYDYATVKYDTSGTEQWVRRYTLPQNSYDIATALAVDGGGNVYVTGYSSGSNGFDYATVKYDSSGAEQWVARYNAPMHMDDVAQALAVDGSGNVYVTGHSMGLGPGGTSASFDYATVKYDASGAEQWVARYNGPGNSGDEASALAVDGGGNVYVTGVSYGGSGTDNDYATVKYAANGAQLWVQRYNGPGNYRDEAEALAVDGAGNVYITGASTGSGTDYDYATVKYAANGMQLWVQRYNGPGNIEDGARALAVDGAGNIYVTGSSSVGGFRIYDFVTVAYDISGAQLWAQTYNGPASSSDQVRALALDGAGNVYVAGGSYGLGTDLDYATVKYSQATPDTTAPACAVQAVVTESPTRVYVPILVTDAGSGVAQVKLTANSTNCRLEWDGPGGVVTAPIGTPLSISPAAASTTVRVVKINTSQRARVELQVWDVAGNTAVCDPVIANLTVKNGNAPLVRVFNGIPQAERYVTLQNGTPGLTSATLTVNGRVVSQGGLTDGQVVALDVAQWLRPGKNTVRIAARGPQNATAVLTIGDVAPSAGTALSAAGAGVNREFAP